LEYLSLFTEVKASDADSDSETAKENVESFMVMLDKSAQDELRKMDRSVGRRFCSVEMQAFCK
jgi:hypothetical protein